MKKTNIASRKGIDAATNFMRNNLTNFALIPCWSFARIVLFSQTPIK